MFERDDPETPEQIAAREQADREAHMIRCKVKGIPMREGTAVDAEGYYRFNLDDRKHDPFEVFDKLAAKCGAQPDPTADARFAMVRARLNREARERKAQR